MKQILAEYFNVDNLKLAYLRVIRWPDRMVKDRFGLQAFMNNYEENLQTLSKNLISGLYSPNKAFKFYEPKASGTQRSKTLLMIEDALVYQAIANIIAQKAYPSLVANDNFVFASVLSPEVLLGSELIKNENPNYFFFKFWKSLFSKFKNSVVKAIEEDKSTYKLETDITGFFDSIPHYNLLLTLSTEFNIEDEILDLLSQCLNVWSGTKENSTPGVGIPQGPLPSFLLANLLLHPLDNLVIGGAYKYYRYMDDIKIYGYSEDDLLNVLIKIDIYLKGHGLSINSKKTSIVRINPDDEDETVRQFKQFAFTGIDYESDQGIFLDNNEITGVALEDLSSLNGEEVEFNVSKELETLNNVEDIIAFWEKELKIVESELPSLFLVNSVELIDNNNTSDIDFIRFSSRYGNALRALQDFKSVEPDENLLKYWLFALNKYFWRASNYILTLHYYKDFPVLKDSIFKLFTKSKNYESYRYHLITFLMYNFKFSDLELRLFFKALKDDESALTRYSLYCLLIKHSNDSQLLSTIKLTLAKEKNEYIKLIVLDFWKRDKNRIENMLDLINSAGL